MPIGHPVGSFSLGGVELRRRELEIKEFQEGD